jgi:drug/metabolite transporter (DMT)-like permease
VFLSQLAGLVALALALPLLPGAAPASRDLVLGAAAGLAIGAGLGLLYRALAVGRMAVAAPTTAVCAVVIPVAAAIVLGERPAARVLAGIALAVVAVVLVGRQRETAGDGASRAGLGLALLSGIAIGVFFVTMARTAPAAGLWPLLVARAVAAAVFGVAALARRQSLRMAAPTLAIVIGGGVLDMLANALYVLATRHGALSVVVTLSSLYPASTVVLALAVLG